MVDSNNLHDLNQIFNKQGWDKIDKMNQELNAHYGILSKKVQKKLTGRQSKEQQ